uniref:VWFA domain-containing protein n=2 Tax=Caenorhabditis japonica TaxID=281687 RepID=A0A8R1IV36_CAEJA
GRARNEGRNMPIGRENDRYFLLTTNFKYPENVKTLSEKNPGLVIDELKKLILPYGSSPVHQAILDAFRALHVNRAQTGIDGYGTGRAPQNSEQVVIILLTDASGVASIPPDFKAYRRIFAEFLLVLAIFVEI